jgi:hypothetical protein
VKVFSSVGFTPSYKMRMVYNALDVVSHIWRATQLSLGTWSTEYPKRLLGESWYRLGFHRFDTRISGTHALGEID